MFGDFKEKVRDDMEISKPYLAPILSTIVTTSLCGVALVGLNVIKEISNIEREIYINKIARERAERTISRIESKKED